ncbi:MAG: chorismate synthase [Planctomycetes bacterium]|nr:chorismate synthase [Planctomycetota bacterium]
MTVLRWTTAGESHGPALLGILEGLPSGLALDFARIDGELARRRSGHGRSGRMKLESDAVEVLAGVRAGRILGSPLALRITNFDATIERLPVPTSARPGHADLAGCQKHTARDPRSVLERASARETAMRTALGAAARQVLEHFGIEIFAHVTSLGGVDAALDAFESAGERRVALREASEFAGLDATVESRWRESVERAREQGDTLGGVFEVRALGLPPGLGNYQSAGERLTARLGAALFSIPAIKGVEFGLGFASARLPGSDVHDSIVLRPGRYGRFGRASNRAGGLEGGMTTGETLLVRVAMKPISTLRRGLSTVDFESGAQVLSTYQRSDVSAVPAASVVGEAVVALELARAFLEKFGGDSLAQVEASVADYVERLREL